MLITSILLSALFAGIVATLVTIAIEKFGGRTGGVLATIPTTIVPAALGMYSISGETEFAQSMSIVPLGMICLLYTSPSPRDMRRSRMPSSA